MADIHVEKDRTGMAVWPWVLGLVVLALLIWAFAANRTGVERGTITTGQTSTTAVTPATGTAATTGVTTERLEHPVTAASTPAAGDRVAAAATGAGSGASIPVASIVAQPDQYLQQTVTGTAQVASVEDNGLWIEQDGQRLFVLVNADASTAAAPAGATADGASTIAGLAPGQQVTLTGVVHDRSSAQALANDVDAAARRIVEAEPAFLFVQADDIDGAALTASADDDW
jgi:hypothetical protein